MSESPPNIRVRRHPERGHHERDILYSIIDGAWYCHAATVRDSWPVVIPTLHIRIGDQLYIHGAVAAGLLKNLGEGAPVCVTITHLDGLVLARSLYNADADFVGMMNLYKKWTKTFTYPRKNAGDEPKPLTACAV